MDSDKSIIIDGVNVAECMFILDEKHLKTPNCTLKISQNEIIGNCINRPNCYFKQLKRLEAEKKDLINYFELRESGMLEEIQYWKNKAQDLYKQLQDNITKNEEIRSANNVDSININ